MTTGEKTPIIQPIGGEAKTESEFIARQALNVFIFLRSSGRLSVFSSDERVIAFEGINGSGKTTEARNEADSLRNEGKTVVRLKGSGANPLDTQELINENTISLPENCEEISLEREILTLTGGMQVITLEQEQELNNLSVKEAVLLVLDLIEKTQRAYKGARERNEDKQAQALGLHMHKLMWYLINIVYQNTDWTIVLDRTPISAVLAMIQRSVTEDELKNILTAIADEIGGIPFCQELNFLNIDSETAYVRLQQKGEQADLKQLEEEYQCFMSFFELAVEDF